MIVLSTGMIQEAVKMFYRAGEHAEELSAVAPICEETVWLCLRCRPGRTRPIVLPRGS